MKEYQGAPPTKILYAPWKEKVGGSGRITLMVPTNKGVFALNDLCHICHIPRNTLYNRLTVGEGCWKRPGVLHGGRYKVPKEEPRVIDPADVQCLIDDDDDLIKKGRRDPLTVKLGSWERRFLAKKITDAERVAIVRQRRLAQKRRDDEYRDYLKHHRAMCR